MLRWRTAANSFCANYFLHFSLVRLCLWPLFICNLCNFNYFLLVRAGAVDCAPLPSRIAMPHCDSHCFCSGPWAISHVVAIMWVSTIIVIVSNFGLRRAKKGATFIRASHTIYSIRWHWDPSLELKAVRVQNVRTMEYFVNFESRRCEILKNRNEK